MRRRWELLRGHKGVLADSAYPYMLTRNKMARDKLEEYSTMIDILKSSEDGLVM